MPSEPTLDVPWKPTEPLKPIQRALSGLSGAPPGIVVPASSPAQSELRDVPRRVDLLALHDELADRRRVARLADGDAVAADELAALEDARGLRGARDGHDDLVGAPRSPPS